MHFSTVVSSVLLALAPTVAAQMSGQGDSLQQGDAIFHQKDTVAGEQIVSRIQQQQLAAGAPTGTTTTTTTTGTTGYRRAQFPHMTVQRSIYVVGNTTERLTRLLQTWSGSTAGAIPIVRTTDRLARQMRWAARVANHSQPLTDSTQLTDLGVAVAQLTDVTGKYLGAVVARQEDFAKIRISSIVRASLVRQRARATRLTQSLALKVPSSVVQNVRTVAGGLDGVYANALQYF
ncbi:hypothetical protein P8C59_003788 [Phyllachora maydis]|uniref:Uncharacterized protein n=1 Tax=Phyllachora maydis TaxID=1825666 RepID=A0AAD9I282_9PEZI|nr:hypothetical protein P8C59_003788 [Phyllachora maydis]